jgi:zinc/manganese transport system substrate-binding protein
MRTTSGRASALLSIAAAAVLLAGCSSSADSGSTGGSGAGGAGAVSVFASTNVWGDIVKQVGGDRVDVLSVISDPSADPHSFEANAQTQLALSKAALVIENGGGYDDFIDTMLSSAGSSVPVINAVQVSGRAATGGEELNEHVWYDLPTADKVAQEVAARLSTIDPAGATQFAANAAAFGDKLQAIEDEVAKVRAADQGTRVAVTEPVPLYLLEAAGLDNLTPDQFSEAVEADTDVPPAVLQQMLGLFTDKKVKALFYNEQAGGPQTDAVLTAAQDNGVAVVPVRETLPEGQDYLTWMQANVTALAGAVGGGAAAPGSGASAPGSVGG